MKRGMILILIFLIPLICASFETGDPSHSINTQYGPEKDIKGWVNISFDDEDSNSVFSDSLDNTITLIDLLKKNSNYKYSCGTINCASNYLAENKEKTKSFYLPSGESKIVGFKISEKINEINSVKFKLESNSDESCFNQIEVDVLNDGSIEFINNKSVTGDCSLSRNYGCFNESKESHEFFIEDYPNRYCQRITLQKSPGNKIGAWVDRNGETGDLVMSVYNLYGEEVEGGECTLPSDETGKDVYCEIDFGVKKAKDYYVCIYSENGDGKAKVKGYSAAEGGCGFNGYGIRDENSAFRIFSEGKRFDKVGTLNITNSLGGETLASKVTNYILENYGSFNCTSGCVVPVKINSKKDQDITLKNLEVKYRSVGLTVEDNFYDLTEDTAKVNSDFQKLYLDDGGFSVPSKYGDYDFELKLDGEEVLSEEVTVEKVPLIRYVTPIKTASAVPTTFKVKVESSFNITGYEWDFGDNKTKQTQSNTASHTYNSTGIYELKVTAKDSQGFSSSGTFNITVGSPKEIIEELISKYKKNLENIDSEIKEFTTFQQESLNSVLNLPELEDGLKKVQQEYGKASTEQEYNKIMGDLLELEIPESVYTSKKAKSIPLYPSSDKINLDVLQEIAGGDYDSKKKNSYVNAISLWNQENIEARFDYEEISANYGDYEDSAINVFELKITRSGNSDAVPYFIIKKIENLNFAKDYQESEESGYVYINLEKAGGSIIFSTTEDIEFSELPAFISPAINKLDLIEEPGALEVEGKWGLLIVIIIFLLIVIFIVYIIMQEWYKKRYETYLFKDRNNLFNLVSYIGNEKKKGLKDNEIEKKLRKSGWSKEQVDYVMKKYAGKNTGVLFEVPIDRILKMFRKKEEKQTGISRRDVFRKYR